MCFSIHILVLYMYRVLYTWRSIWLSFSKPVICIVSFNPRTPLRGPVWRDSVSSFIPGRLEPHLKTVFARALQGRWCHSWWEWVFNKGPELLQKEGVWTQKHMGKVARRTEDRDGSPEIAGGSEKLGHRPLEGGRPSWPLDFRLQLPGLWENKFCFLTPSCPQFVGLCVAAFGNKWGYIQTLPNFVD